MSETVQIALVTGATGFLGALLGAVGAVLGPWWVKKTELKAERKRHEQESLRRAIVDFSNKKLESMRAFHIVFSLGQTDESFYEKLNDANKSVNELYSLIKKEDSDVKNWINRMGFRAFSERPTSLKDLERIDLFLGLGIQYLIAWHVGENTTSELKPFGLDKQNKPVKLENWESPWPN